LKLFRSLLPWILLAVALFILPAILDDFRLNLFGRYFALAITALAIDLIWGYTGLLSLGQGIFFALGGYAVAMYLMLNTKSEAGGNGIPKFFENYGLLPSSRRCVQRVWPRGGREAVRVRCGTGRRGGSPRHDG